MAQLQERRLVGVYRTAADACAAADVAQRAGADPARIRIDEPLDHVVSVEGEMRDEMNHTLAGPGAVGPWTKEMLKGMTLGIFLCGAIGIVLALPFAAIQIGDMALWARLLIFAAIGGSIGATVGWILGGAFGARRPDEALAAERGVTLALTATPAVEKALARTGAIRLDVVDADGQPVATVMTRRPENIVRKLRRHAAEEELHG